MLKNYEIEKSLKRFIKNKKIGYSASLLVGFLITGDILIGAELNSDVVLLKEIKLQKEIILKKLEENRKRLIELDREIAYLLEEGDYYAKTLEDNKQFFFPLIIEHRHSRRVKENGNGYIEEKISENNPNLDIPGKITPNLPYSDEFKSSLLKDIRSLVINTPKINITTGITGVETYELDKDIEIVEIKSEEINVNEIKVDEHLSKTPTVDLGEMSNDLPEFNKGDYVSGHSPDFIKEPNEINVGKVTAPAIIEIVPVSIAAKGFGQGQGGYRNFSQNNQVVVENYKSYTTNGENFDLTFGSEGNAYKLTYGGGIDITTVNGLVIEKNLGTGILRDQYYDTSSKKVGEYGKDEAAFISDTIAADSKVSGTYNVKYEYGEPGHSRIFFSLNPAGLGNVAYNHVPNYSGGVNGKNEGTIYRIKTSEFDGTLNLENKTENSILIGMDHQVWDEIVEANSFPASNQNNSRYNSVYSVLNNKGILNLGKDKTDKNMIGIMIDAERETASEFKTDNHKTINNGIINVNGSKSLGISFEPQIYYGKKLRDDLYLGNININGENSTGLRIKNFYFGQGENISKEELKAKDYFDETRVFGNQQIVRTQDSKIKTVNGTINVAGNSNVGVTIGKGLSSNASGYLNGGKYVKDTAEEKAFEAGKVNPVANIHGLSINVNGTGNIGLLRDKDYAENNTNDMVIQKDNNGKEAITNIGFGENAKSSVLFRADKYGITLEKDLAIDTITQAQRGARNIVLQSTVSDWHDDKVVGEITATRTTLEDNITSVGSVTNKANITGSSDALIGMMASGFSKLRSEEKAKVTNLGNIELTGKNTIGMSVLGANSGELKGSIDNKAVISVISSESLGKDDYNIGVYNEGDFTISNAKISTAGNSSVGIYSEGKNGIVTLTGNNELEVDNGAIGIYLNNGKMNSSGNLNLTVNRGKGTGGMGIYANEATINIVGEKNKIDVIDGDAAIASVNGAIVNISDADINYSGDGYALYTNKGGKILFDKSKESTVNLGGNAFGMKIDLSENNKQEIGNVNFHVTSNNATVFNLVNSESTYNVDGLLNGIYGDLQGIFGDDKNISERITSDKEIDKFKVAVVDGGKLVLNEDIHQYDECYKNNMNNENTSGFFYFKRFLGQRLDLTVAENKTVDGTMTSGHADKYFDGQIAGLEMNSSSYAQSNEEAKITLKNGTKVIANRLDGDSNKKGAIGIYGNFGTITLEKGSIVEVEKEYQGLDHWKNIQDGTALKIDNDTIFNEGIGVYAVNSTKVDNQGKIDVAGDKAIGVYSLAYREESGEKKIDEFGTNESGNKDQGKIDILNNGDITLEGAGTVGIYAENNNNKNNNSLATVINSGNITVGSFKDKNSSEISSIGVLGIGVQISNSGTISVGEKGVGIYATENSDIKSLGKVSLGENSVGIVVDKDSKISATDTLVVSSDNITGSKAGVLYHGNSGIETNTDLIDYNINIKEIKNGRAIITLDRDITINNDKSIAINGENSQGIRTANSKVINNGTIDIGELDDQVITNGSVGIVAVNENATISNSGVINVNSNKGIGIYLDNTGKTEENKNRLTDIGTININGSENIGVALHNEGITLSKNVMGGLKFAEDSEKSTGLYVENGKIVLGENQSIEISSGMENILLYAGEGTDIANNGEIVSANSQNIGLYLDKGASYSGTGRVITKNGAVGIYAEIGETEKFFENLDLEVDIKDEKDLNEKQGHSIGLVLKEAGELGDKNIAIGKGNITLKNTSSHKGVGIHAEGDIGINLGNTIITHENNNGYGVYLTNGASLAGGTLTITGTGANEISGEDIPFSVGVLYTKTTKGTKENKANINILKKDTIAVYSKNNLNQVGNISIGSQDTGVRGIGIYSDTGYTSLNQEATINLYGKDSKEERAIGIYALGTNTGETINYGTINANGRYDVGIVANESEGLVANRGTINVNGNTGTGIYTSGDMYIENTGDIFVNSKKVSENDKTIGIGIYLRDGAQLTKIDEETAKKAKLYISEGNVGIYAEGTEFVDKKLNFIVDNDDYNKGIVALAAASLKNEDGSIRETNITKNTEITIDKNSVGIFAMDTGVNINGTIINAEKDSNTSSIGVYLKNTKVNTEDKSYEITNSTVNMKRGAGIILNSGTEGTSLTLTNSNINLESLGNEGDKESGVGVYVKGNGNLVSSGNTYNVKDGIAIYGDPNSNIVIGNETNADILNLTGYSIGAFTNGGIITVENADVTFGINKEIDKISGSLVYAIDGVIENKAEILVGNGSEDDNKVDGFIGLFARNEGEKKLGIINSGNIDITGKNAVGIGVLGKDLTGNSIVNSGTIRIKGINSDGKYSNGIYAESAEIKNSGEIIAEGTTVGLYYDNIASTTNFYDVTNNKITLIGPESIGAYLTGKANKVELGTISGNGNTGVFLDNFRAKNFNSNIYLKDNSIGIFTKNSTTTIDGNIEVGSGENTVGIYVSEDSNINLLAKVIAGENGTAVYNSKGNITISDLTNLTVGKGNSTLINTNGGTTIIENITNNEINVDGINGLVVSNGGKVSSQVKDIVLNVKNGGKGISYVGNTKSEVELDIKEINVLAGEKERYSIGIYAQNEGNIGSVVVPSINQTGDKTVGIVLNNSYGSIENNINLKKDSTNGIGMFLRGGEKTAITGIATIAGKNNIGIFSTENGDISYSGDVTIAGNEIDKNGSMGIYKAYGEGTIEVGNGRWIIGDNSFGVVVENKETKVIVKNNSNMTLESGAIGIYSLGKNEVTNNGNITIENKKVTEENGVEKFETSVGIYMDNSETDKAYGYNTGNINVNRNSVGVQAVGNVKFENSGTMRVSDGGIGLYATNGAEIYNTLGGKIILGSGEGKGIAINNEDSNSTVGMMAVNKSSIHNLGEIYANNGIGMYVDSTSSLYNEKDGKIYVHNGIGIQGTGTLVNSGNIYVSGRQGQDILKEADSAESSTITIREDLIDIGSKYVSIGGILHSDNNLKLNDPIVDITANNGLGFEAPSISGSIRLDSNFTLTGNGYSYNIQDFMPNGVANIKVKTSPLFKTNINGDDLEITKVNYKDIDKEYKNQVTFYDELDEILREGGSNESEILKKINEHLDGFGNNTEFYNEYRKITREMKGNVYSHVQSRMQDINRAFDNSFDEMESSYNLSKDTDKFSVIYTDGDFRSSKSDMIDYDYNIAGLLYMKEYEGTEFGNKHGYTLGFTGSKFKFKDRGSSEEKVYSLRVGTHNVKDFNNGLNLLTRVEAGYNYHDTERKVAGFYENDAQFNSYHISLENRFRQSLYKDLENDFGVYLGLDLEYGKFEDIKESGELALKVKHNDYFNNIIGAGFNGTGRKYIGNDWSLKLTGDVGYFYNLGENYSANESKIKNRDNAYINLMSEVESKGRAVAKAGVGLERLNYMGVTLEGEMARDYKRDEDYWRVSLRFNYKY